MAEQILHDDTKIKVQSLVPVVRYTCPITLDTFLWLEVGDTQEMTFKQLQIMNSKHPRFFSQGWIKPLNDDVLEKLGLKKFFESNLTRSDLKLLCGYDVGAAEEMLVNLSPDAKAELAKKAIKAAEDDKINNIKIIRLIEKYLDIEIMDFI